MMRCCLILQLILILITGCSSIPTLDDVLPDRRTEYKKSEALPDLEVPPDLTEASKSDSMSIPGEGKATLSEYKKEQQSQRGEQPQVTEQLVLETEPTVVPAENQWLVVRGSTMEIWPELRRFFIAKGYTFDLDDAELGVLGTNWSMPVSGAGANYRNKFKVFSEAGSEPGIVVLYVSNERQEEIGNVWRDLDPDAMAERLIVGELNQYLNNDSRNFMRGAVAAGTPANRAELEDSGDGKLILVLPDEYTSAWMRTENALERSGLVISKLNQDRGIYTVSYRAGNDRKKKGWMSKLAFWRDDEDTAGKIYQVSLTGVGQKTELIILDELGNWNSDPQVNDLIRTIQGQYNSL